MRWLVPIALTVCAAAACSGDGADKSPTNPFVPIDDQWADTDLDDGGDGTLNPIIDGRHPKRLTVDQLRRVVPQLTDGHTWHQALPFEGEQLFIPMFDLLGPTLGEADYVDATVNFLDPIPSFMKYVDEMASQVCIEAILEPNNEAIVQFSDVDDNLRFLRLKFHGVYVPPESTDGLEDLRVLYNGLFNQYGAMAPPWDNVPWLGVCIAVMTDPEFYIY